MFSYFGSYWWSYEDLLSFGVFQREVLKSYFGEIGMTTGWGETSILGIISKLP